MGYGCVSNAAGDMSCIVSTIVGGRRVDSLYAAIGSVAAIIAGLVLAVMGVGVVLGFIQRKEEELKERKRREKREKRRRERQERSEESW